jgi:hypothetical protein
MHLRTTLTLAVLASLLVGCAGHQHKPTTPPDSTAKVAALSRQWRAPGAEKVAAGQHQESPRQRVADQVLFNPSFKVSDRPVALRLFGQPASKHGSDWYWLVSSRPPADGLGGACTRYLVIRFRRDGGIDSMSTTGETCPRGLND